MRPATHTRHPGKYVGLGAAMSFGVGSAYLSGIHDHWILCGARWSGQSVSSQSNLSAWCKRMLTVRPAAPRKGDVPSIARKPEFAERWIPDSRVEQRRHGTAGIRATRLPG